MEQGKYEFVRLKSKRDGKEDTVWYFRAKTLDEITLHYNKVLLPILQVGFNSFSAKFCEALDYYINRDKTPGEHISIHHADNDVENAIRVIDAINHGEPRPLSMFETTNQMLLDAYKTRIETLMKYGECYLANGVQQFGYSEEYYEICEQRFSDEFVFPTQRLATIDDVRIIQWPGGLHFYAKVGNVDIVDSRGNQKWDTEEEAKKEAAKFIFLNKIYL
jgi:hypothetical protein